MAAAPEILRHRDADGVAAAVAARLVTRLADIQSTGRVPSIVLTGGSIAVKIHEAVAQSPAHPAVDWSSVDVWFGDERFVPAADPDRNVGQAAAAMLDRLPFDPARIHPMPPSDGELGNDVDAAAAAYAEELGRVADGAATPTFDVLMLGIGPDGHCASLFPGRPEMYDERPVVAVRDSPKPPPTRITLTLDPLMRAHEVWWVAAGDGKAQAVHDAVTGSDPGQVPASGPKGLDRTLWLVDDAAASKLPA
ncbi:MAG TPA: 6-phosphogluconolactonase [Nocardioidaceae bacterium]|nr:6-phosphogluconolactonase [Nocardioidaceae bacterium]